MRVIVDVRPMMEAKRGGVGIYAAETLSALVRRGTNDYALFCNGRPSAFPLDMAALDGHKVREAFSRYPNRLLNASFAFLRQPKLERLVGPADALFLPNLNFVATRLPYAVTVHDLSFVRSPTFFSAKQRLWHRMINVPRLLREAAAVVAVSEHTKLDVVETFGIDASKIFVASPAADSSFRPQKEGAVTELRNRLGLRKPYFLYLGAIEPRKNITGIIEAFDALGTDIDADLVIAGGKGWLYEKIFRRAERSAKRNRIKFLGYVEAKDKPALYAGAIALVYPSFYEGFGMPPLESMAVGTPVIASNASSLGEVVGDAGLLVKPESTDSIAEAMRTVMTDEKLRAMMRERGFARARNYSWDKTAHSLEHVFAAIT